MVTKLIAGFIPAPENYLCEVLTSYKCLPCVWVFLCIIKQSLLKIKALIPTAENIKSGMVVLLEGYQAGATVIALAAGMSSAGYFPHLNPQSAYYYTNTYRWILRYISLLPYWIGGNGGNYCETFNVWKRRFYYMDEFVPGWLRSAISVVDKNEREKEEKEFKKFKTFAEPAFGKHFRYPSKSFYNFQSEMTMETQENMDISSVSIDNV